MDSKPLLANIFHYKNKFNLFWVKYFMFLSHLEKYWDTILVNIVILINQITFTILIISTKSLKNNKKT